MDALATIDGSVTTELVLTAFLRIQIIQKGNTIQDITNCLPRGHEGSSLLTQDAATEIVPTGSHYC